MEIVESYLTQNPCYKANVNRIDSRYVTFQQRGPIGLMLHSVGCAQPDASVFVKRWNSPNYTNACVHAFINANSGIIFQTLPWNYRGWHGGGSSNNTHVGVEMCESGYIRYDGAARFTVLNKAKAQADCKRAYNSAVELFAMLCEQYNFDPLTKIVSHAEGYRLGIATNHGDPEHYWRGLGMPYTMDGFRADVKTKMEDVVGMTEEELEQFVTRMIDSKFPEKWNEQYKKMLAKLNDNDAGKWSKDARQWATSEGLIAGVGKLPDGTTNYAWEQPLTREQYATVEYKQHLKEVGGSD